MKIQSLLYLQINERQSEVDTTSCVFRDVPKTRLTVDKMRQVGHHGKR